MANKNDLTDREKELMALAWLCFSEKPKPDYKKLASLAGMTNPASASNAWAKIQKKITAQADCVGSATPELQGTPKATPAKKKRTAAAAKAEVGEVDDEESPTKKVKTRKGRVMKVKDEVVEDAGDGAMERDGEGEAELEQPFF